MDDLDRHLALAPSWEAPPAELRPWLAAARAVPFRETEAQERYLRELDAPAHPEDPGRAARGAAALAFVRALADADEELDWAALRAAQGLSLGSAPPAFRVHPAYAHGGRARYGWAPELEARFAARLVARVSDPLLDGLRRYLELIHVHPFPDGNARAARLVLEHALRRGRVPTPELEPLVRLPKPAGDLTRTWQAARLLCRGVLRAGGVCPGSVEAI